jgi:hypothetical protein
MTLAESDDNGCCPIRPSGSAFSTGEAASEEPTPRPRPGLTMPRKGVPAA